MHVQFRNYLSSLSGAEISTEDQNTISFKYNDLFFLFVTEINDPYYIRLMLPKIAKINDPNINKINIQNVINNYNKDFKVVKVILWNDEIWLSIEQFIYSKENVNDLFTRAISILETVINDFREKINKNG